MSFDQLNEGAFTYAQTLIKYKARQLVGKAGLTKSDRDDLRQEMWVDLLSRLPRFDASRAKLTTFMARVVEHKMFAILRHRSMQCRDYRREEYSLNELVEDADGKPVRRGEMIPDDVHSRRTGADTRSAQDRKELERDQKTVLAKLRADQQDLCELLRIHPRSVVARMTGMSRRALEKEVAVLRERFRDDNLHEYLRKRGP